jgi:hypothetical protein
VLGDVPSLREIWGDAALYVPPEDHDALHAALMRLIDDLPAAAQMAQARMGACAAFHAGAHGGCLPVGLRPFARARGAAPAAARRTRRKGGARMRFVMFCHSLVSDWNHGNAHFLRGVCSELLARGHEVAVYEPLDAWSRTNLEAEHGKAPLEEFARAYPELHSTPTTPPRSISTRRWPTADLVLVHEWNDHALVRRIGLHRRDGGRYRLLFHDTHHRSVTEPRRAWPATTSRTTTACWPSAA